MRFESRPSRPTASSRPSVPMSAPSTASTSPRPAPCSACSAPTAPARRRPCASSRPCSARRRRARAVLGSTWSRRPSRAPSHRPRRPVRRRRREPDRPGEPAHGRPAHRTQARGGRPARAELLERFELDRRRRPAVRKTYSGGMRRRLDLAGRLVRRPPVLFLDEPTTGLDPPSRIDLWEVIEELVRDGTTVLLTTQYLEEADRLADRIAVIDHGQVIAEGTADRAQGTGRRPRLEVDARRRRGRAAARPRSSFMATGARAPPTGPVTGRSTDRSGALIDAARRSPRLGSDDVTVHRPTLDDVFLTLTGDAADGEEADGRPRRDHRAGRRARSRPGSDACLTKRAPASATAQPRPALVFTIQPIMFVLLFAYVFGGAIEAPGHDDYIDFLIPGIFVQQITFGGDGDRVGLADDLRRAWSTASARCRSRGRRCSSAGRSRTSRRTCCRSRSCSRRGSSSASASTRACPRSWPASACCCCSATRSAGSSR